MAFQRSVEVKDFLVFKCSYVEEWDGMNDFGRRQCVEGVCTSCGEVRYYDKIVREGCRGQGHIGFLDEYDGVPVERFSGDEMICPCCGDSVECVHVSEFGASDTMCRQGSVLACVRRIEDTAVLISYEAQRCFSKAGRVEWTYLPWEAYWLEEEADKRGRKKLKLHKATGYTKNYTSLSRHMWEEKKRVRTSLGDFVDWMEPFGYETTDGTLMEKSGIVDYCRRECRHADRYMDTWAKHHNIENIAKTYPCICYRIMNVSEITEGYYGQNRYGTRDGAGMIDWKAVRPNEMLGLSREDARRAEAGMWTSAAIRLYRSALECTGERISDENMARIFSRNGSGINEYLAKRAIGHGARIDKVLRYAETHDGGRGIQFAVGQLVDTWDMMKDRGAELDASTMWPKNLTRTHDAEAEAMRARKELERSKPVGDKIKKLYDELIRYSWVCGDLMIEPARDDKEMKAEGRHNHNCVARYATRVANRETQIWFIRRLSEPSVPYYTLELNPKDMQTVRQNLGMNNCEKTKEIDDFEKLWIAHIREVRMNMKEVRANA